MTSQTDGADKMHYYLDERIDRALPELRLTRLFFPRQQAAVTSQLVLFDELRELLLIADQGVAMTKLGWWYDEWQRLEQGQPRHPLTCALQDCHNQLPGLESALKAAAAIISGAAPQSVAELGNWLDGLARPLAELEPTPAATLDTWRQIWLLAMVADLQPLARIGRAPWPMELAAQTQLVREQLGQEAGRLEGARRLWQELAGDTGDGGHAAVFLAVRRASLLDGLQGKPPAGRWRQLWLAWRAARRSRMAASQDFPG